MKVIIVEDEIRIREGISHLLAKLDKDCEIVGEAENGLEGIAMIRKLKPDIVITDIRMPEMDGLQMLEQLYAEDVCVKAIVLSAYSEFEYARKAMKLGVTEYLLKPVVVGDFSKALTNVTRQVEQEHARQPETVGTLEQVISGFLWGNLSPDGTLQEYLNRKYNLAPDTPLMQVCLYLGSSYEQSAKQVKRSMERLLAQRPEIQTCILESTYEKAILAVFYGFEDGHGLERWFQYQLLQNCISMDYHAGVGLIQTAGYPDMRQGFDTLSLYMDWNIVLGEKVVISYPKITQVQTVPCVYPVELENQLKAAICAGQPEKIKRCTEKFLQYFQSGRIYPPREIKDCYVRYIWSFLSTAAEVGCLDDEKLEQQKLLEIIMNARTVQELVAVLQYVLDRLRPDHEEEQAVPLAIKRARQMIHEFYQTGITLDEIAIRLNITPEYLGTQFHKQVGVNFSTYIRDFRMNKAKELLIGTHLKLYEIAQKVGYSDPKYFSRVFKECTGQLPAQYRKAHK